jgi:hypothetical protein
MHVVLLGQVPRVPTTEGVTVQTNGSTVGDNVSENTCEVISVLTLFIVGHPVAVAWALQAATVKVAVPP